MIDFKFFLYSIYPPTILVIGFLGNLMGILVMSRKKLVKIGPRNIYRYLFLTDSVYLIMILEPYFETEFNWDFCIQSNFTCKAYSYVSYLLQIVSPMLLVYISVEKLVSIKNAKRKNILRSTNVQLVYFLLVSLFSLLYYLPVAFLYDIATYSVILTNSTGNTTINTSTTVTMCSFIDLRSQTIVSIMDLVNRVLLPFILMSLFTFLLVLTVFKSRKRSLANYTSRQNKTFLRDIRLLITSILLNIIYLVFHLPLSIYVFFPDYFSDLYYMLDIYLLYACYSINFYLIFVSNSLFRGEFLLMFKEFYYRYLDKGLAPRPEWI